MNLPKDFYATYYKALALFLFIITAFSCDNEEPFLYTGDLTVQFVNISNQNINLGTIGLFDIVTTSSFVFDERYALRRGTLTNGIIEFNELNPGNYTVVSLSSGNNIRMSGQITAGKRTTIVINY